MAIKKFKDSEGMFYDFKINSVYLACYMYVGISFTFRPTAIWTWLSS